MTREPIAGVMHRFKQKAKTDTLLGKTLFRFGQKIVETSVLSGQKKRLLRKKLRNMDQAKQGVEGGGIGWL